MKRLAFIVLFALLLGLSACSGPDEDEIYEITDRFFATQIMSILQEPDSYVGRLVRFEGILLSIFWAPTDETIYSVVRFGDDCCGPTDILGLEVYLNNIPPLPDDTWVEVTGRLEIITVEGYGEVIRINATSMVQSNNPRVTWGW